MIEINLISDKEKKERLVEKKVGLVVRLGVSFVFAMLLLASVMFSAQVILAINLKSVKEETRTYPADSVKEIEETENLLKEVESLSKKIEKNSQDVPRWGKFLRVIADISPEGVKIDKYSYRKTAREAHWFCQNARRISGLSRELKRDSFKNLNSPISNLVSPKDFSFMVEFDVEKNYLNQL